MKKAQATSSRLRAWLSKHVEITPVKIRLIESVVREYESGEPLGLAIACGADRFEHVRDGNVFRPIRAYRPDGRIEG